MLARSLSDAEVTVFLPLRVSKLKDGPTEESLIAWDHFITDLVPKNDVFQRVCVSNAHSTASAGNSRHSPFFLCNPIFVLSEEKAVLVLFRMVE
jgi:hypothetical protein